MHHSTGTIAQLVEQRTFNPFVVGSTPAGPTKFKSTLYFGSKCFFRGRLFFRNQFGGLRKPSFGHYARHNEKNAG